VTEAFDHGTVLTITYATPECARRVERALSPEVDDLADDRSRTTLSREATQLDLRIRARDLVGLRAALNTWLSLLSVAEATGLDRPGGGRSGHEQTGEPCVRREDEQ
jgi:KEOPS complex subunit Pcc1